MTNRLLPLAAAAAFTIAFPAAAQHDASKSAAAAAGIAEGAVKDGVRTVEMQVTEDGFVPSKVKANKGEKLRLVVTRKTDRTCATEIVIPDHGIEKKLPLGQPVTVELTPKKSGEIKYACGMGHITGVVFIP
jgi:plastocyanin domain-containing protein